MTKKRKKVVKRLAFLTLDSNGEITDLELTQKNTVLVGSWGEKRPAKIQITYEV